ncbi:hypothetical protein VUR80DRAFT_2541 [Thermomyces stellatus]
MAVTHLVLFRFRADLSPEAVSDACAKLMALKDTCIHPATQEPYILSLTGGKDHSPKKAQDGITHAFRIEFESTEDRDYYVKTDPAHQSFMALARTVVERAIVVDYTPGQF